MKRNLSLFSIAVASVVSYSAAARADDITIDPVPFVSSASRAEVRGELDAFKRSGVDPWARNYDPLRDFQSGRTRAEVTAEYVRDRDTVASLNGEDSGSRYLAELDSAARSPLRQVISRR